jgi:predicted TIM-barrel fold metal-dependent hydrolase
MPNQNHSKPIIAIPAGAVDCHMHVFGVLEEYPCSPRRSYTPRPASLEDWGAMATKIGLQRQVLVQASPYGVDNRCMLVALQKGGTKRCRGVAVIDDTVDDDALKKMHTLGVRGVRVNAATFGVEDPQQVINELDRTIERVAPLGWHVQIFASLDVIDHLMPYLLSAKVPIVIDHMGMPKAKLGIDQPGFGSLIKLLKTGHGWVKLSGCYRVSDATPDYADAAPIVEALISANPRRAVWGTDWPHTGAHSQSKTKEIPLIEYRPLDDGHLLNIFSTWCGDKNTLQHILVDNPAELYDF